jgi:glycosyltransferase involved in cell wall biosynthesis
MVETGGWGGLGHYAHCLCEALAKRGMPVTLATHRHRHALRFIQKRYALASCFIGDGFASDWRRLISILHRRRPRIVHFQSLLAPRRDWVVFWLARFFMRNTSFVITAHNILPHERRPLDRTAYRLLYRAAAAIIVHSEASLNALNRLVRLPHGSIRAVIPHGHYGTIAAGEGLGRSEALRILNLDNHRYLLFFGAIRPYKGLDNLLRAVAGIRDWPRDLKLLIAGHPFMRSEQHRIEALARELAVSGRALFRFRYFPEEEIPALFRIADLVVLPYRRIDQSGVLMAALAAGRAVLATPVGGFPEVVGPEIGFLSKTTSADDIRAALLEALAARERWPKMGERAAMAAELQFGWEEIAARTEELYRRLVFVGPRTGAHNG